MPPSYEVGGIAKRIKTARLRRKTNLQKSDYPKTRTKRGLNALCVLVCDNLYLCQIINIQCVILIINYLARTRSIASLPCKIVLEDLIQPPSKKPCYHQGGRRETASGFYPWGKMDSPRERVVEGLCGWWHGNSFPMTQSAQSHRQMRSIPHCSKAVYYVFVSVTQHFSTEPIWG